MAEGDREDSIAAPLTQERYNAYWGLPAETVDRRPGAGSLFDHPGWANRSGGDTEALATQGRVSANRNDPYARGLMDVSSGSAAGQRAFTPNTPDWQRGMEAAKYQRAGVGLNPEWAARGTDFQGRVPVEALQHMAHQMAKAANMRRNMQLLQVAMVAAGGATAGATQGLGPLAQAAIAGGAGASNAAVQGGIQGNFDPQNIAIAGASGAAGAGIAGSGLNPAVSGAAAGGINALARGFSTGTWDPADAAWAVGSGAGGGALRMAGVPAWAVQGGMPLANAGYQQARGRPFDPATTGIQTIQGAGTGFMNARPQGTQRPPWAGSDPANAPYLNDPTRG